MSCQIPLTNPLVTYPDWCILSLGPGVRVKDALSCRMQGRMRERQASREPERVPCLLSAGFEFQRFCEIFVLVCSACVSTVLFHWYFRNKDGYLIKSIHPLHKNICCTSFPGEVGQDVWHSSLSRSASGLEAKEIFTCFLMGRSVGGEIACFPILNIFIFSRYLIKWEEPVHLWVSFTILFFVLVNLLFNLYWTVVCTLMLCAIKLTCGSSPLWEGTP